MIFQWVIVLTVKNFLFFSSESKSRWNFSSCNLYLLPLVCSLCLPVKRESPSFLQPCMYLYDLTRVCAIGVQFFLLSENPLLWPRPRTPTHASSTHCLVLFAPGTFLSCAMQQLYFVICSISTLEYQFTALRYSVSSKSEKWKERSYITGLVLQSQPATSRIALQGFPPSKASPSSPKVLLPQPLTQFTCFISKPVHLYDRDALHPTLKGDWRDKAQVLLKHHAGSHLAAFQYALPLSVLTVSHI